MQLRRILAMAAAATVPLIAVAPAVSASAGTVSASAGTVHHPKLSHDVYVTGKDFRFVMPPVVPSGIDRFTFRNAGTESHMMQLFRLKASYAEFLKALSINPPNIDAIEKAADAVGGAGSIEPGGVQVVKDKITPGHYVAVCFDAGPDGVPHFAKGMIKQFTAASDRGGSWSYAKGVVQLRDFKITLPRHFSGHGTYWVYNKGPSVHEFAIVRLLPGKTLADFVASLSPTYKGPEVTTDAGGFQAINPHHLGQVKLDLPRGHYVATCFVPEANGTPHAALGMYAGFIVH